MPRAVETRGDGCRTAAAPSVPSLVQGVVTERAKPEGVSGS